MKPTRTLPCPHCQKPVDMALFYSAVGSIKSAAKAKASAENGKKGGRPPQKKGKDEK